MGAAGDVTAVLRDSAGRSCAALAQSHPAGGSWSATTTLSDPAKADQRVRRRDLAGRRRRGRDLGPEHADRPMPGFPGMTMPGPEPDLPSPPAPRAAPGARRPRCRPIPRPPPAARRRSPWAPTAARSRSGPSRTSTCTRRSAPPPGRGARRSSSAPAPAASSRPPSPGAPTARPSPCGSATASWRARCCTARLVVGHAARRRLLDPAGARRRRPRDDRLPGHVGQERAGPLSRRSTTPGAPRTRSRSTPPSESYYAPSLRSRPTAPRSSPGPRSPAATRTSP